MQRIVELESPEKEQIKQHMNAMMRVDNQIQQLEKQKAMLAGQLSVAWRSAYRGAMLHGDIPVDCDVPELSNADVGLVIGNTAIQWEEPEKGDQDGS